MSIYVLGVWMAGKGICYLEKKAKYKRKVCFMTLSILAVTGILIWYKYYNFIAENLSHFFGISLADESVDRSSWNFFYHVYSDILSCGCLSWRCRSGKPFGCIFISFFFPESDFRTDRTVEMIFRDRRYTAVDETEFLRWLNRS